MRDPNKLRKDEAINIIKVVKFIQQNPDTYLTEIVRQLGLSKKTVIKCLRYLDRFLIKTDLKAQFPTPTPNLPIYLRIKEPFSFDELQRDIGKKLKFQRIMEEVGR